MDVSYEERVEHLYYGKGYVSEIYRDSNEVYVRFDKEIDGLRYHRVKITSLYKN
jgi:hypothetical protein